MQVEEFAQPRTAPPIPNDYIKRRKCESNFQNNFQNINAGGQGQWKWFSHAAENRPDRNRTGEWSRWERAWTDLNLKRIYHGRCERGQVSIIYNISKPILVWLGRAAHHFGISCMVFHAFWYFMDRMPGRGCDRLTRRAGFVGEQKRNKKKTSRQRFLIKRCLVFGFFYSLLFLSFFYFWKVLCWDRSQRPFAYRGKKKKTVSVGVCGKAGFGLLHQHPSTYGLTQR